MKAAAQLTCIAAVLGTAACSMGDLTVRPIKSNLAAEAAARAQAKEQGLPDSSSERLHAMDYLAYAFIPRLFWPDMSFFRCPCCCIYGAPRVRIA